MIVVQLELSRWQIPDWLEQSLRVEPVHPLKGCKLDIVDVAPWAASTNDFGLEQPNYGLCQGVVVGVSDAADGGYEASFGKSLGVANRKILHPTIAMVNQLAVFGSGVQRLLERVEGKVAPQRARNVTTKMRHRRFKF